MLRRVFLAGMGAAAAWPWAAYAQRGALITPENELERVFVAALTDPEARPLFRRELLASQVALALASSAVDAPPREVALGPQAVAGAIFTSASRLNGVLGPAAARRVMGGREAFERLRGKHVVLNYRLVPMLTLEPQDVASYLDG